LQSGQGALSGQAVSTTVLCPGRDTAVTSDI
jgi:hypothetical protein